MPAFHFRLQPLLDRRRQVEDGKGRRYAVARRERDEAVRACERLVSALARHAMFPSDAGTLAVLDAGIEARQRRARNVEAALEDARQELIAAGRERRALEKLYERRRRAYEEAEARRDEHEIDEANARRPAR